MPEIQKYFIKFLLMTLRCTLLCSLKNIEVCSVDQLVQWTKDWQVKFNNEKCKILHVGKNHSGFKYFMDSRELRRTEIEKDLGVFVDKDLKFEQHINETVKIANKTVSMTTRYIHYKNKEIVVPPCKSLGRPILEYVMLCGHHV